MCYLSQNCKLNLGFVIVFSILTIVVDLAVVYESSCCETKSCYSSCKNQAIFN
jgi:hypothetical protein